MVKTIEIRGKTKLIYYLHYLLINKTVPSNDLDKFTISISVINLDYPLFIISLPLTQLG